MPTAVTKQLADDVLRDIRAAAVTIAAKHGLRVQASKGIYDTFAGEIRLPVVLVSGQADATHAELLGLPADIVGRTFTYKGETFTVVGLNPRKPKFCIEAERADGKRLAFPVGIRRFLDPTP